MRIILRNEPLLFIEAPPVFVRVEITDEESTSIFVQSEEEYMEPFEEEAYDMPPVPVLSVNPSIANRIADLSGPFQRQVYKPLQFIVGDETVSGEIDRVIDEIVFVKLTEKEDVIVELDMGMIEEILWRGKPFMDS